MAKHLLCSQKRDKHYYYLLLRDDFRIGLVISPRVAALAWGEAESQYSCPRTNNWPETEIIT